MNSRRPGLPSALPSAVANDECIRQAPSVERRRLIERLALVFQQSQIMQRIVNKVRLVVAADVGGDRFAAAGDLDPVDIPFRQDLLMSIARRNRIVVVAGNAPNDRDETRVATLWQAS